MLLWNTSAHLTITRIEKNFVRCQASQMNLLSKRTLISSNNRLFITIIDLLKTCEYAFVHEFHAYHMFIASVSLV